MRKYLIVTFIGIAIIISAIVLFGGQKTAKASLDGFAQCLRDKKITMYGAEWCQYCQKEKAAFGDSFRFVPYVECPDNPQQCLALGISGYPTWIFPDGKQLKGLQGIEKLSRESACALETSK